MCPRGLVLSVGGTVSPGGDFAESSISSFTPGARRDHDPVAATLPRQRPKRCIDGRWKPDGAPQRRDCRLVAGRAEPEREPSWAGYITHLRQDQKQHVVAF